MILLYPPEKSTQFHYPLDPKKILAEGSMHKDTTYQGSDRQDFYRHGKKKLKKRKTRCFCEAYTGLPVVRATENQKALNCVVLKYSIPVSEEQQIKEKRETLASGLTC